MQREFSISSRENSGDYSLKFTGDGEYDYTPSMYSSIFPPEHSSILDYLNDRSSDFSYTESDDSLAPPCFPQFQQNQQLLNQDLMNRHRTVLSRLLDAAKQMQTLRQENVNLKMANIELNNRLNLLLNTASFHGVDAGNSDSLAGRLRNFGVEEEGTSENEAVAKSPASVMDSGQGELGGNRVQLPKSISVRSNGYLKGARAGGSGAAAAKFVKETNESNGAQMVYVKAGCKKEQAVELEVYNQGMCKTELCNKWQQTGACPYGENCQFAHGIAELRPVLRHPRYKTEVCRMVLNGVSCPYGHRCHFRHSLTEQEQLMRTVNSKSLQPMSYR